VMLSCNHNSWISFYKNEQVTLRQTSAFYDIVSRLDTPEKKYPSLVVLTGNLDDPKRLHGLVPRSRKGYDAGPHGGLQLELDHNSAFNECPILVAHGCVETFNMTEPESVMAPCHTHAIRELQWPGASSELNAGALFRRILQPFAQLVCFFITAGESSQRTANRLRDWSEVHRGMGHQPRLLIVAAPGETRRTIDIQKGLLELFQALDQETISLLRRVSVHGLDQQQTLQDRIRSEVSYSREDCMRHRTLFSAVHMESLFSHACDHLITSGSEPFDMLVASRLHRPVSSSVGDHVADLLDSVRSYEELTQFAAPFIAECLRLDNYTKDVHGFAPADVFATHYRSACSASIENKALTFGKLEEVIILRAGLVKRIETQFLERSWSSRDRSRSRVLGEFREWLSRRITHRSCLACLTRAPEHKFWCQHVLCEECCMEFGRSTAVNPNLYQMSECPLCATPSHLRVRVRPATAGLRVLAIDGGGIRAVIPIQFLRALQRAVGSVISSSIPIQELFDLSFGTSSGCMVNLALYGLGMEVGEAFDVFKALSSRVFQGRTRLGFRPIDSAYSLLAACRKGWYPAEDIDGALDEIFGKATMLDHPYMTAIGARTGFPVVNLDSLETCVITSYNGVGEKTCVDTQQRATYRSLRSSGPCDEISVKDAMRGASAAPLYFTPKSINEHGRFMDGGLSSNNPSLLAWQEARKIAPGLRRPDQFVSVGTGISKESNAHDAKAARHYWKENFDGDKHFASMLQMMDASYSDDVGEIDGWFRRFNLPLDGQPPDLADASAINSLAEVAQSYFESHRPIDELALSMIALLFYFELRCRPVYENGRYVCYGRILCRLPAVDPAYMKLIAKLEDVGARFVVHGHTLSARGLKFATLDNSGNFSRPVCLRVGSLSDPINIALKLPDTQLLNISASSSSIASFVKLQRLDWPGSQPTRSGSRGPQKRAASNVTVQLPAKRGCKNRHSV
ncbi:acyl transferase/acyl hydrolase/lysophospholipase, partial [Paraphoma chrysanthemicola]